jgi:hypothetical protein
MIVPSGQVYHRPCELPNSAFYPARRAACGSPGPRSETGGHPTECQASEPRHASGQQRRLWRGAVFEHEAAPDQEPDACLSPRNLHRESQVGGSSGQVSAHYLTSSDWLGCLLRPVFPAGAGSWRVDVGSRLAKPSRSDATGVSDLDAAAGSRTMDRRGRRHRAAPVP